MEPTDFGEKAVCPKCGSREVRAMSRKELVQFYGRDRFVLKIPRTCKSCGHGWEVHPSKAGCIMMIAWASAGFAAGIALIGLGIYILIDLATGAAVPNRVGRKLWGSFGVGAVLIGGSLFTLSKYLRLLRAGSKSPVEEAAE